MRVEVLSDRPEHWFNPGMRLTVESGGSQLTILESMPASPGWFLRFGEVASRLAGERLIGAYLTAVSTDQLEPGRVYWDDVIGVTVRDVNGGEIGIIHDCYRTGGAEVYILTTPDGGEIDLPAIPSIILTFKPRDGIIVADLTGSELGVRKPTVPRRRPLAKKRVVEP